MNVNDQDRTGVLVTFGGAAIAIGGHNAPPTKAAAGQAEAAAKRSTNRESLRSGPQAPLGLGSAGHSLADFAGHSK